MPASLMVAAPTRTKAMRNNNIKLLVETDVFIASAQLMLITVWLRRFVTAMCMQYQCHEAQAVARASSPCAKRVQDVCSDKQTL